MFETKGGEVVTRILGLKRKKVVRFLRKLRTTDFLNIYFSPTARRMTSPRRIMLA